MQAGLIRLYRGKHNPEIVLKVIRRGYDITIGIDADSSIPVHPTFTIPEMYGMNGREVRAWIDKHYPEPANIPRQSIGQ